LPAQARIHTKLYPVIKPNKNSFVFETSTDPAIFLYLDPEVTREKFENTVSHEMHHIGFASIETQTEAQLAGLPTITRTTVEWIGAFGEGFAMLAAAGGPDVYPHEVSTPEERARWNQDMAHYNQDLRTLDQLFLDILHGKFKNKDEVDEKAFTFFWHPRPLVHSGLQSGGDHREAIWSRKIDRLHDECSPALANLQSRCDGIEQGRTSQQRW